MKGTILFIGLMVVASAASVPQDYPRGKRLSDQRLAQLIFSQRDSSKIYSPDGAIIDLNAIGRKKRSSGVSLQDFIYYPRSGSHALKGASKILFRSPGNLPGYGSLFVAPVQD